MRSPATVYPAVLAVLVALGVTTHQTAQAALAERVLAVLTAQSLAPADLARALRSAMTVPARQRFRRLARSWRSPLLTSGHLTPLLVRAALTLAPSAQPLLVLDSVRCGGWEVFTVGLQWHRRTLLVGWAVLPYPWPKGRFTPTVCALLAQVAAAWPQAAPAPELLADRGFPSGAFFRTLAQLGWRFTIRLRASDVVTVDGEQRTVRSFLAAGVPEVWRHVAACYGHAGVAATLVVGQGVLVVPWHQRDAGSARARRARAARRTHDLHAKHPRQQPDGSTTTDAWVVLFTSHAKAQAAVSAYRWRWAIEGSYRDGQSGCNGRQGWNLEPTLAQAKDAGHVERVVGLWALALLLQSWIGDQVGAADAPASVQAVVRQWTTSGRLSVFARGRLAFADRSGELDAWLVTTLQAAATQLTPTTAAPAGSPRQEQAA
jgi:hypothetical protein